MSTKRRHSRSPAAGSGASLRTVTIEIAGLNITLPLKFRPGHVLTENQAKILDAAYQRQFTNNQDANAKARKLRFEAAKTDAERLPNTALTAAEITALYQDYEPSVGSGVRTSGLEKLRSDMAWRFWTGLVAEHNKAVEAGGAPVIAKAGAKPVAIAQPPRKGRDQNEADAKAARELFDDNRATFIARLLEHGTYGPQIAALVEAELEARKLPQAAGSADAVTASVDLI